MEGQQSEQDFQKSPEQKMRSELNERADAMALEVVDPQEAKVRAKNLYRTLAQKNQSYSVNYNDFDSQSGKLVQTEWGKIFTIQGVDSLQEDPPHTELSVFYDKADNIVGYGGLTADNQDSSHITFKVFPEQRGNIKAEDLLKDHLAISLLTTTEPVPNVIRIPTNQQYNPQVERDVTPAPVFYRKLGFESSNTYPDVEAKVKDQQRLSESELKALAHDELKLDLLSSGIKGDFSRSRV